MITISFLIDNILDTTIEYELILCKPNKEPISVLDEAFNINYNAKFPTTDELSFDIPYYVIRNYKNIINPHWKMIKGDYLVLFNKKNDNTIVEQKYFIIINPKDSGGEKEIKSINCYSLEYELNKKLIRSYKMPARKLYSINNEIDEYGQVGVMNYVTTLTSWNLDEITFNNIDAVFVDSKGLPLYRAFDVSESTLFDFLINTVQKSFSCIFLFDTINKKISVHKIDDIGTNKGLYISESNYIKTINQELKNDEIVTRLYCYGKDNISIAGVNPTGVPYIENFTYYKTTDYMSQELIDTLNIYEAEIINYPEKVENNNPLISLGNQQYKIICNSSKANAFKNIKEICILSSPEYIVPLNRCVFNKSNPNYIGDGKGKINISLNDTVSNKLSYTYEVKIASTVNADMSVTLNGTNLIITLGTDATGSVDDSKNLTMYISGAINNINEFKSVVEINGKLYKAEPQNNFNLNEIIIDGTGLSISYPSDTRIIYAYDTFLDLRNELLILFDEKRNYQNELFTLMNGYYEISEEDSNVLIVDGLYQIQDKIDVAIKNNSSLAELNAKLSNKEIEVCDKQLQINHVIEDIELKDIFNKHNIYTKTNVNGVYKVTHKNGVLLSSSNDNLINTKQSEINNYRNSISKENNFTIEQLIELDSFVKEKTWSDSTYEDEEDLYNEGLNQLSKISTPPLSFDLNVVDFLQIVEGKIDKTKLMLGDLVTIGFDKFDLDMVVRLVGYNHEIDNYNLKLNFSNKDKYDDPLIYIAELQKNAITTSTTINMDKYKWDKSEDNAIRINDIIDSALDASKNAVLAGKNQDVQIGRTGISLTAKNDAGVVLPEQIKMISNLIVFTKDNWQTASTAISPQGVYAPAFYGKSIVGASGSFEGIEIYDSDDANAKKIIDIGRYIDKDINNNDVEKRGIAINSYNGSAYKNRILLNAEDSIKVQKYSNDVPVDQLYFDIASGDLKFDGDISGASGTFKDKIAIGSGNDIFKADSNGIYLGNTNFIDAPFKVDMNGKATCSSMNITGGVLTGVTLTNNYTTINPTNTILSGKKAKFDLDAGTFRLGDGDDIGHYKLKFDGTDLHFGNGSIKWNNLDITTKTNIGAITVNIIGGTRSFVFDKDGVNQTTATAFSTKVVQNGAEITPTSIVWSYGGFLSGNTATPTVGNFTTNDTWIQADVTVGNMVYYHRQPISGSKVGATGYSVLTEYSINGSTNWHTTFTTGDIYMRQSADNGLNWTSAIRVVGETGTAGKYSDYKFKDNATQPAVPTGDAPSGWSDAPPVVNTKLWMIKGTKNADGTLIGTWSTPIQLSGNSAYGLSVQADKPLMFKYDKNGMLIGAQSITLTANIFNIVSPTYIWFINDIEDDGLQSSRSITISYDHDCFNEGIGKFKCVVDGFVNGTKISISDTVSIVKMIDGSDSYSIVLNNDSINIPCNSDGTNPDLTLATTKVKLYKGINAIAVTLGDLVVSGCTAEKVGSDGVKINSVSADVGYVDIPVLNGSLSVGTKRFSFAKAKKGNNGDIGINGTRTAILEMYQWSASAPTIFPSGTSIYTWSTGQFTAPATLNNWSLTPPTVVLGQTLWICRTIFADSLTTTTSSITWDATVAYAKGGAGVNGTRTAILEVYQWASSTPTSYPSGTSTYTWADGSFTAPSTANGWSLIPGSPIAGYTLWGISITYVDTDTTSTSSVIWNSSTPYAVGKAGNNGTDGSYYAPTWVKSTYIDFSQVASPKIIAGNAYLHDALTVGADGNNYAGISGVGTDPNSIRFWAGNADKTKAPFRVTQNGILYATNANITGSFVTQTINNNTFTLAGDKLECKKGSVVTFQVTNDSSSSILSLALNYTEGCGAYNPRTNITGHGLICNNSLGNTPAIFGHAFNTGYNDTSDLSGKLALYSESGGAGVRFAGNSNVANFVMGNVGIGTTSPSYKLHVEGQTKLNGNVGIGTNPYVPNYYDSNCTYDAGELVTYGGSTYECIINGITIPEAWNPNHWMLTTTTCIAGSVAIGADDPGKYKLKVNGTSLFTRPVTAPTVLVTTITVESVYNSDLYWNFIVDASGVLKVTNGTVTKTVVLS